MSNRPRSGKVELEVLTYPESYPPIESVVGQMIRVVGCPSMTWFVESVITERRVYGTQRRAVDVVLVTIPNGNRVIEPWGGVGLALSTHTMYVVKEAALSV